MRGIDETWQTDLVDMLLYARENKGFKYLLTIIDVFSEFAWVLLFKSITGDDISESIKSVLIKGRAPENLHLTVFFHPLLFIRNFFSSPHSLFAVFFPSLNLSIPTEYSTLHPANPTFFDPI